MVGKHNRDEEMFFSFEMPSLRHIEKIMQAGNRNPYISQFYSILVSRRSRENHLNAPIEFVICADLYKVLKVFEKKGRSDVPDEVSLFDLALQDATSAALNMFFQATELEITTRFIVLHMEDVQEIKARWKLPDKVVPIMSLCMGYPEVEQPEHVSFPEDYIFFEEEYPAAKGFLVDELMFHLDQNSKLIDYYKKLDQSGAAEEEKEKWDWYDLLTNNCAVWKKHHHDFQEIVRACGVNITYKKE